MWPAASCSWCHGVPATMHWTDQWGAKISPSSLTLFLAGYSVTVWEKHLIQRPTVTGPKEACHPTDQLRQWVQLEKYLEGAKGLQRRWGTSKGLLRRWLQVLSTSNRPKGCLPPVWPMAMRLLCCSPCPAMKLRSRQSNDLLSREIRLKSGSSQFHSYNVLRQPRCPLIRNSF